MTGCCDNNCSLNPAQERQRRTLKIVLAINAVMFGVIVSAAIVSKSSSLLSDSLDNFGDAFTYALSLYAVAQGGRAKSRVALVKGLLIFLGATVVVVQMIYRIIVPEVPIFEIMGGFSLLSLLANSVCLALLWRHRHEDINMSSVWECSRNDIASNISVFLAAFGVWAMQASWPDMVVASALVILLYRSAWRVIRSAWREILDPAQVQFRRIDQ